MKISFKLPIPTIANALFAVSDILFGIAVYFICVYLFVSYMNGRLETTNILSGIGVAGLGVLIRLVGIKYSKHE